MEDVTVLSGERFRDFETAAKALNEKHNDGEKEYQIMFKIA
jgi:hypothetical protein